MEFADIEMLDVPDDSSVTSETQTASNSESGTETKSPAPKTYPSFQVWLLGHEKLQFQFDSAEYTQSYKHPNEFVTAQAAYLTKLYKSVEELACSAVGSDDTKLIENGEDEPIGVISGGGAFGASKAAKQNGVLVNSAFRKLVEAYNAFYETVQFALSDEDAKNYEELGALLDCVQANWFPLSETQKPEEILEWINRYDPKPDDEFIDAVMYNTPTPYAHPQFWTSYLGTLLSRGMFERAVSSIAASKYEELAQTCPPLYAIIEDLSTLLADYQGMAFKGRFAEWKYLVCEFRDNFRECKDGISELGHATMASQIHDLLCLITGLPKTTASFVPAWYDMYGALALFQVRDDPSVYADYYKLAIAEKGSNAASDLEQAFRDVLAQKYLRVILAIDARDPATAAYVSKLFEMKDFFASYYVDFTAKIIDSIDQHSGSLDEIKTRYVSDYLLTRHAYECLEVHELVPVGLGILLAPIISNSKENAEQSKSVVSEFLPQYQCFTNDDLEWALTICAKLNLTGVVKKLFMKQGAKSLKDGHICEALNMLAGCHDDTSSVQDSDNALQEIHRIVWDLLFQDCLLNSTPVPDQLLTNIITGNVGPDFDIHPVVRQCLAPYAVLAELFMNIDDASVLPTTVSRLFRLIKFSYMPKKFVPLLLAQFLPLLAQHTFGMPQLIILTELIDTFEPQWKADSEDCDVLYEYAIESIPEDVPHDWRVQLQEAEQAVPESVEGLLRALRETIVGKIARVYITA